MNNILLLRSKILVLIVCSVSSLLAQGEVEQPTPEEVTTELVKALDEDRQQTIEALSAQAQEIRNKVSESEAEIETQRNILEELRDNTETTSNDLAGLRTRMARLEQKFQALEAIQEQTRLIQEQQEVLKDKANEVYLASILNRYGHALAISTRIEDESGDLLTAFDWGDAMSAVSELSNPTNFEAFTTGLTYLKDNQKKAFKLPDNIPILTNPYVSTVVSFIGALAPKGDLEERNNKLGRLNCILTFAMEADKQMNFIATEQEYLKKLSTDLADRADNVKENMFELVNIDPLSIDLLSELREVMDREFIDDNIKQLEQNMYDVLDLYEDYQFMVNSAVESLQKADYALQNIKDTCPVDTDGDLEELLSSIDDRKDELSNKLLSARDNTVQNFQNELRKLKAYNVLITPLKASVVINETP
ncbi:hypothetical protein CLV84_3850 [Neolewinella xylanilytica]|uniref:t-SNARE coiled-coil homology domain-containing protein n=1 Tax=Neolewinella xylanilytica TaxID=1514080 RepID=A0A2S6I140_9BACT|nr:hypothetical protein [Neolewinella xylanilytica]PPK84688.1 hypothetical protein CLV84_3850 [Neolewinella xylanilytica]